MDSKSEIMDSSNANLNVGLIPSKVNHINPGYCKKTKTTRFITGYQSSRRTSSCH